MKRAGCFALALIAAQSAFGDGLVWKSLGPAPLSGPFTGRVSAVACHPVNPSIYYVGGADGGVWVTLDAGATWRPLTDHMPSSAIGAIAIDPVDPNTIYVGTGEANFANHSRYGLGVYKTTDGGSTWQHLAASSFGGRCISKILINPQQRNMLYAAVTPAGGFPEKAAARNHPLAGGPLGVFKSTDGGVSWVQLAGGLPNEAATDLVMTNSSPDTLYVGIGRIFGSTQNGIYKTTNGGSTWTKLGGGLPTSNLGRISIGNSPASATRLYALIVNPSDSSGGGASTKGVYRSDNEGATWTLLPGAGSFQATYGWYLCVVGVHPTNPDLAVFGGLDLIRTQNAGSTFSTITAPHVDNHAISWDASFRLLCGNDGGLHRSTNNGGSWGALNNGLAITQFYAGLSIHPSNPLFLLGGLQDNGSNKRTTNSQSWSQVLGGDGGWTQISQANANNMFCEYQGAGNLYRSTNGGGSFNLSASGINTGDRNAFLPPYEYDAVNANRILYGTHRIYESLNGGSSWTAVSGDVTGGGGAVRALAIAPSNGQRVYIATNDGRISMSSDGGRTFTVRVTGNPGWPRVTRELTVHPTNDQTVYRAVSSFGANQVQVSTNAGSTWQSLDGDLPDVPANVVAVDIRTSPTTIYIGTDDGVYVSSNSGVHWLKFGHGMPRCAVIDLRMDTARNRLVAATQGRGAWEVRLLQQAPPK